jgi:hypothetical protein
MGLLVLLRLLVHQNGSSPELESRSDFNFSFAFDNFFSYPKTKTKSKRESRGKREYNKITLIGSTVGC